VKDENGRIREVEAKRNTSRLNVMGIGSNYSRFFDAHYGRYQMDAHRKMGMTGTQE
jgi:hypothetical protein